MQTRPYQFKQVLEKTPIFSQLASQELDALSALFRVQRYAKGRIIFEHGGKPAKLHFLLEGGAKSVRYTPEGKEIILHMIYSGELFAILPTYLELGYTGTAITTCASMIGHLERKDLLGVLQQFPNIALKMMGMMALRTKYLLNRIEEQTALSPMERVVRFLARECENQQSPVIHLPHSKNDISLILGTVPETLSRCLTKLVQQQLIRLEGRQVTILDHEKLFEIGWM